MAFGERFKECVEDNTYSANDTKTLAGCPSCNSSNAATLSLFYQTDWFGIVQSLKVNRKIISDNESNSLYVSLNKNVSYNIIVSDTKLQLWMGNPEAIPRTFLVLETSAGILMVYLKVKYLDYCVRRILHIIYHM